MSSTKCSSCDRIKISDLSAEHELVVAAIDMAEAHAKHETMHPALVEVLEKHPYLHTNTIMTLWLGVNAARQ